MPPLPTLRARDAVRTFERLGWSVARQQGNHIIMVKEGSVATFAMNSEHDVDIGRMNLLG